MFNNTAVEFVSSTQLQGPDVNSSSNFDDANKSLITSSSEKISVIQVVMEYKVKDGWGNTNADPNTNQGERRTIYIYESRQFLKPHFMLSFVLLSLLHHLFLDCMMMRTPP